MYWSEYSNRFYFNVSNLIWCFLYYLSVLQQEDHTGIVATFLQKQMAQAKVLLLTLTMAAGSDQDQARTMKELAQHLQETNSLSQVTVEFGGRSPSMEDQDTFIVIISKSQEESTQTLELM